MGAGTTLRGKIKPGMGAENIRSWSHMQSLLLEWKPLGKRITELQRIVGRSPESVDGRPEIFTYTFDSGFSGTGFLFTTEKGIIVGVDRDCFG